MERQKAAIKEVEGCSFAPQLRGGSVPASGNGGTKVRTSTTAPSTGTTTRGSAEGSTRSQGSLLATAGKPSNKHAKWADEGPYFVDGNPAALDTEQGYEYENDDDQQVRAYYGDHSRTQPQDQAQVRYHDPESAEEHPHEQVEAPMRRIPLPQRSTAPPAPTNISEYSIIPNVRFNLPEEGTAAYGDRGFARMQIAPQSAAQYDTLPMEETHEDDVPTAPSRMKVPLPTKSAPPAARGAITTVGSAGAGAHGTSVNRSGGVQPTTISVRVPTSSTGYEDLEYVDYEPSPSSGVMLARSAPDNLYRRNAHFSAAWKQQDVHYADAHAEEQDGDKHSSNHEHRNPQNGELYEEGEVEQDAQYNGLPFRVGNQDRFTPPRAGVHTSFPSPPYQQSPDNAAPLYSRTGTDVAHVRMQQGSQLPGGTRQQGQDRLIYGTQQHQSTVPAAAPVSAAPYSFAGLAEPEDKEYGNLSLFDVGQLDFNAHDADMGNSADEFAPPPPPPPSDEVEWTEPPVRGLQTRMPPPRGQASATSTPMRHQPYNAAGPTSNVYGDEQDEYGYGEGMEYSPSPATYAYDIL